MFLAALIILVLLVHPAWAQQKGWETEWNETLAAAKKEGKVVVANSPDPAMRDISAKFQARFGITVEHLSAGASRIAGRLRAADGVLFIDLFRRGEQRGDPMAEFTSALLENAVDCPTANHGFGWDAMALCAVALSKGGGNPLHAIEYLESGAIIEGVTGQFRFSRENHNGREGPSPTRISCYRNGRLVEADHV